MLPFKFCWFSICHVDVSICINCSFYLDIYRFITNFVYFVAMSPVYGNFRLESLAAYFRRLVHKSVLCSNFTASPSKWVYIIAVVLRHRIFPAGERSAQNCYSTIIVTVKHRSSRALVANAWTRCFQGCYVTVQAVGLNGSTENADRENARHKNDR